MPDPDPSRNVWVYWQNDDDASGYAAGGITVLATGRTEDGRLCRKALVETAMAKCPTDRRVRTWCRDGTRTARGRQQSE